MFFARNFVHLCGTLFKAAAKTIDISLVIQFPPAGRRNYSEQGLQRAPKKKGIIFKVIKG